MPDRATNMASEKPVHTVVLDTGALIKNEPPVSTLLSQAETLVTVPAIISEIKDATTRHRVETTLRPFLSVKSPNLTSIKFVTEFARKTGDLAVLSKPDIQIIALTYEIECERNGGDWRLRKAPGQKGLNGTPPKKADTDSEVPESIADNTPEDSGICPVPDTSDATPTDLAERPSERVAELPLPGEQLSAKANIDALTDDIQSMALPQKPPEGPETKIDSARNSHEDQIDSDSDSDGWITPSNLRKTQAADAAASVSLTPEPKTMQVGVLTSDFAMQNVILQMNLNLLSPSMSRVKHLKTYVLRCHACFNVSKDLSKQFCPRCGQPSLTRVSCSTDANGQFKLHLKKNMQWNNRGNKFSVPKPVHGSANGRIKGGGKDSWGHGLILAEDQKEYQEADRREKRQKERSLMDEDYLPSILTGERRNPGGRPRVGAGRNVNAKKR